MRVLQFFSLILTLAIAPILRAAAPPPPPMPELPNGLGVNIHFTDPKAGEMKMIADAGFRWIRMDFAWSTIERQKGQYDFSAYDRLIKALEEYHIRAIFILDYSNRMYDNGQSPNSDDGRAGFAKWAAASVGHFKGHGILWEMYNEPNISFWKPKPNVEDYAKLALAVGKAIRGAEPKEVYIGPASSTIKMDFLEACFKAGCLEYWSAVSVHPYRQKDPETVGAEYQKLRELIDKYAPTGRKIPIISGEWGYSSAWKNFDEERQGKYLPREMLINLMNDVPVSIYYDWHDDGTNPQEPEHHFGTVHFEYRAGVEQVYDPKPAYLAMKSLSSSLSGCRFSKRLEVGSRDDYVLEFKTDSGEVRYAAWTTEHEAHAVQIAEGVSGYSMVDWLGRQLPAQMGLKVTLTDAPQYIRPAKAAKS
jgi:polysaccharide biosynthesis protein PslG